MSNVTSITTGKKDAAPAQGAREAIDDMASIVSQVTGIVDLVIEALENESNTDAAINSLYGVRSLLSEGFDRAAARSQNALTST